MTILALNVASFQTSLNYLCLKKTGEEKLLGSSYLPGICNKNRYEQFYKKKLLYEEKLGKLSYKLSKV